MSDKSLKFHAAQSESNSKQSTPKTAKIRMPDGKLVTRVSSDSLSRAMQRAGKELKPSKTG